MSRNYIIESSAALGIFEGVDKFYFKQNLDIKKAGMMGASHYLGIIGNDAVGSKLNSSNSAVIANYAIQPAMSGAIYSLGTKYTGIDNRSLMFKFLMAYGSSAATNAIAPTLIGLTGSA